MAGDPRQVRNAMRAMETHLQGMVEPAEQQLRDAEQVIARVTEMIEDAMAGLNRALDDAESDLAYCESQVDDEGRRPNCSRYYRRVQKIRDQISHLVSMSQQFERSTRQYTTAAAGLREVIGQDIPNATHWLRERERALEKFESGSVGVSTPSASATRGPKTGAGSGTSGMGTGSIADPALNAAFHDYFGGMGKHGSKYKKEVQRYFRDIVPNDPNQPRFARGWINQEKNRISTIERAKAAGLRPPGGDPKNIKGIPTLQVGHSHYGLDLAEAFHSQGGDLNKIHYYSSKRLGLTDIYR